MLGCGEPSSRPRQGIRGAGWRPLGHVAPQNSSKILHFLRSAQQAPTLDLSGNGERRVEATPSYHPMGPSLGGSWVFLLCGAQGAGWPKLQDLAGWGRRGQSSLWGPGGRFGVAQNSPTQGGAERGVGHLPHGLLSSYKQRNGVLRVQGLPVETHTQASHCLNRK